MDDGSEQIIFNYHPSTLLHADPAQLKLYLVLASLADRSGFVSRASRPRLARLMGYSQLKSVDRLLKELERMEVITIAKVVDEHGGRGVNEYQVHPFSAGAARER